MSVKEASLVDILSTDRDALVAEFRDYPQGHGTRLKNCGRACSPTGTLLDYLAEENVPGERQRQGGRALARLRCRGDVAEPQRIVRERGVIEDSLKGRRRRGAAVAGDA